MNDKTHQEFSFNGDDFERVRKKLYRKAGISLSDNKDALVYSRLARRLRALSLQSFDEYLTYLKRTPAEEEHFINALTTNLTSFFREPHHFTALAHYLRAHPGEKTIWCAASSTGEEPYSIAMTVAEVYDSFDNPVAIIASDIDSQVLEKAQTGIYREDTTKNLSAQQCQRFLHRGKGTQNGRVRVVPELRKNVTFRRINLTDTSWPIRGPIDIIFCRNVMIYFDKQTQISILKRMINLLPDDGLYFAGHSENFNHNQDIVLPAGKTLYRPARHRRRYG
ncbi:CheR family methyltransferase [Aestuariibacter sp. A3R04]|uniref:CheR family methyltransferase n=1 Tax=Aestuariibacter sp. A3R04 TaxID=2841571 RepID=UPI001C09F820|nr:CheR family methyltransferase [Aestuariibacter sp. A3R04]MBU3021171.1 chemotaxis protein CheR [Aestuariibacter sp. A3R04]